MISPGTRPRHPLAGEWTLGQFSDHLGTLALFDHEPIATPTWTIAAGRSRAQRSISRSVRRDVARRRRRTRARPRDVRRLRGPRRPASTARSAPSWRPPHAALQARRPPDWTDEIFDELREPGCVDSSTSRASTRARSSTSHPTRPSTPSARGLPRRLDRGSCAHATRRCPSSSRTPTASPGTPRSTPSRTSRRSAGRLAPSTSSRPASARSSASSPPTTTARRTGSAPTAAVSGSCRSGAGISSCSPRSFTRTRRTTSPRAATTPRSPRPTCPVEPDAGRRARDRLPRRLALERAQEVVHLEQRQRLELELPRAPSSRRPAPSSARPAPRRRSRSRTRRATPTGGAPSRRAPRRRGSPRAAWRGSH